MGQFLSRRRDDSHNFTQNPQKDLRAIPSRHVGKSASLLTLPAFVVVRKSKMHDPPIHVGQNGANHDVFGTKKNSVIAKKD